MAKTSKGTKSTGVAGATRKNTDRWTSNGLGIVPTGKKSIKKGK